MFSVFFQRLVNVYLINKAKNIDEKKLLNLSICSKIRLSAFTFDFFFFRCPNVFFYSANGKKTCYHSLSSMSPLWNQNRNRCEHSKCQRNSTVNLNYEKWVDQPTTVIFLIGTHSFHFFFRWLIKWRWKILLKVLFRKM